MTFWEALAKSGDLIFALWSITILLIICVSILLYRFLDCMFGTDDGYVDHDEVPEDETNETT